jgi:hypothetical protein
MNNIEAFLEVFHNANWEKILNDVAILSMGALIVETAYYLLTISGEYINSTSPETLSDQNLSSLKQILQGARIGGHIANVSIFSYYNILLPLLEIYGVQVPVLNELEEVLKESPSLVKAHSLMLNHITEIEFRRIEDAPAANSSAMHIVFIKSLLNRFYLWPTVEDLYLWYYITVGHSMVSSDKDKILFFELDAKIIKMFLKDFFTAQSYLIYNQEHGFIQENGKSLITKSAQESIDLSVLCLQDQFWMFVSQLKTLEDGYLFRPLELEVKLNDKKHLIYFEENPVHPFMLDVLNILQEAHLIKNKVQLKPDEIRCLHGRIFNTIIPYYIDKFNSHPVFAGLDQEQKEDLIYIGLYDYGQNFNNYLKKELNYNVLERKPTSFDFGWFWLEFQNKTAVDISFYHEMNKAYVKYINEDFEEDE